MQASQLGLPHLLQPRHQVAEGDSIRIAQVTDVPHEQWGGGWWNCSCWESWDWNSRSEISDYICCLRGVHGLQTAKRVWFRFKMERIHGASMVRCKNRCKFWNGHGPWQQLVARTPSPTTRACSQFERMKTQSVAGPIYQFIQFKSLQTRQKCKEPKIQLLRYRPVLSWY